MIELLMMLEEFCLVRSLPLKRYSGAVALPPLHVYLVNRYIGFSREPRMTRMFGMTKHGSSVMKLYP